jgi:hypothetical protein
MLLVEAASPASSFRDVRGHSVSRWPRRMALWSYLPSEGKEPSAHAAIRMPAMARPIRSFA